MISEITRGSAHSSEEVTLLRAPLRVPLCAPLLESLAHQRTLRLALRPRLLVLDCDACEAVNATT